MTYPINKLKACLPQYCLVRRAGDDIDESLEVNSAQVVYSALGRVRYLLRSHWNSDLLEVTNGLYHSANAIIGDESQLLSDLFKGHKCLRCTGDRFVHIPDDAINVTDHPVEGNEEFLFLLFTQLQDMLRIGLSIRLKTCIRFSTWFMDKLLKLDIYLELFIIFPTFFRIEILKKNLKKIIW